MVDKRQVSKNIKRLQRIKTWQLVIVFILMAFVSATFLRLNNIGMVERRTAVVDADSVGDSQITQARLYDLQRYVTSHMNTNMGVGVYLEATYQRDSQMAYTLAAKDNNPNGNIYKKAQEFCMPKFTGWSRAYFNCTLGELAKYPATDNLVSSINLPKTEAYIHVYVSPIWSSDFAGWSVLICIAILTMIVVRVTSVIILKLLLKHRYKSI